MTVDDICHELRSIAVVLGLASHLPRLGPLASASAALMTLASDRALVQSIFDKVTYGLDLLGRVEKWLADNGFVTAAKYLTTFIP